MKFRLRDDLRAQAKRLARRNRQSLSQFLEGLVQQAATEEYTGPRPDESAIRDMSILIAVELGLKLLEASIPGGPTLARRLAEDAAHAAIERVELVESILRRPEHVS